MVARRPRLIGVERQLGKLAIGVGVVAFFATGLNTFGGLVFGTIAVGIAFKLTNADEDFYYVARASRLWRRSVSATGEDGSWYG